jgi:hypothetical protein
MAGKCSAKAEGNPDMREGGVDLFDRDFVLAAKISGPFNGGLTSKEVDVRKVSSRGEGA